MIKVIVFDFDGVIVDSNALKENAWSSVFIDRDDRAKKIIENIASSRRGDRFYIIERALIELGEPKEKIPSLVDYYANRYNDLVFENIINHGIFQGVPESLNNFSKRYSLYINSATPEQPLKEIVERLELSNYFKGIHGSPASKLDNLKRVKELEGIDKGSILMVGDSDVDFFAAKSAGVKFIGVRNSFNKWSNCEFPTIESINEIKDLSTLLGP